MTSTWLRRGKSEAQNLKNAHNSIAQRNYGDRFSPREPYGENGACGLPCCNTKYRWSASGIYSKSLKLNGLSGTDLLVGIANPIREVIENSPRPSFDRDWIE